MRKKTETKREAILEHALQIFRKEGFEGASMARIAAEVGGSKATLYNYFPSKEELLLQAMLQSGNKHAENVLALLRQTPDLPSQLQAFVRSLLTIINSQETIEVLRVAIAVGAKTNIGKQFYELGTQTVWTAITQVLKNEVAQGRLKPRDPTNMAMHLRCLCEAELIRNLMGAGTALGPQELDAKANCIVDIFLDVYGLNPQPK